MPATFGARESIARSPFALSIVQNPIRDDLLAKPIQLVDGWVTIPDGPGLGVEIDRAALERFRIA
jgi:L-alanine-DL-glutamate epimerase-like enolase superfamily enzyme